MLTFVNIFREGLKINLVIFMEFPTGGGEGSKEIIFTTTKNSEKKKKKLQTLQNGLKHEKKH